MKKIILFIALLNTLILADTYNAEEGYTIEFKNGDTYNTHTGLTLKT